MNRSIAALTILLLAGCSSTESLSSASTEVTEIGSAAQSSTTTVPGQTDEMATTSTVADRPEETSSTTTEPEPVHLYGPFTETHQQRNQTLPRKYSPRSSVFSVQRVIISLRSRHPAGPKPPRASSAQRRSLNSAPNLTLAATNFAHSSFPMATTST